MHLSPVAEISVQRMKRVINALLKHIFQKHNAHNVVGFCNSNNKKSTNLMEMVGMKRDGVLREGKLWHTEWCDEFVYSILEREFFFPN